MAEDPIIDALNTGRLLVFDYTPHLTIVGTQHADLQKDDRDTIERIIDESDFVALEWDTTRNDQGYTAPHFSCQRSNSGSETFTRSKFDELFLNFVVYYLTYGNT